MLQVGYRIELKSLGTSVEKLWSMITISEVRDIRNMASDCDLPYDDVCEILQEWIRTRKLTDLRVDMSTGKLVEDYDYGPKSSEKVTRTVTCSHCGDVNTIVEGENNTCEYYGLMIK